MSAGLLTPHATNVFLDLDVDYRDSFEVPHVTFRDAVLPPDG